MKIVVALLMDPWKNINFKSVMMEDLILLDTSRAPQLQPLEDPLEPPALMLLPEGRFITVRSMYFSRHVDLDNFEMLSRLSKFSRSQLQLQSVTLSQPLRFSYNDQQHKRYLSLVTFLVRWSYATLQHLATDLFWIELLVRFGLPQLSQVKKLHFELFQGKNAGIQTHLIPCNLEYTFPAVTQVSLSIGSYNLAYIDHSASLFSTPQMKKHSWPAVTRLSLMEVENFLTLSEATARDLAELFPSLKYLKVDFSMKHPEGFPFPLLWSTWPCLERLELSCKFGIQWDENLDAVFCGIYPAEAAILRGMDIEFLRNVNIVSPFPAINHLRGLRDLKIRLESPSLFRSTNVSARRVTFLVAFKQLRNFKMEVTAPA